MPLILDVLTHIDERSAAAGARELEQQFERSGEAAGVSFGGNLARGLTGGFRAADFESMTGVLSSAGMLGQAASHGKALGVAFAGGITVAAAAGLVDLGVKVGETFEQINRDITLHTAASGKALEGLKSQADALVGGLDTSTKGLGTSFALLQNRLQLTGDDLDKVTHNVQMLQDRFGDFNVQALTGALQNFGVQAGDVNNTIASLAMTSKDTGVSMSDLTTNLAASSDVFKDLHLNAEQSAAMLGLIEERGIPAAKAISGLEMGMKSAHKVGMDFNTFMNDMVYSIGQAQKAGDEKTVQALELAVGGPRRWAELQTSFAALGQVNAAGPGGFGAPPNFLPDLEQQTKTLGNYWDEVKNKIASALAPPGLSVTDEVSKKMESLIGFIDAHATDLRNLFETSLDAIENVVGALAEVGTFLGQHPVLIDAITVAFEAWLGLKAFGFVLTGIEAIVTWLGTTATAATVTGAAVDTAATTTAATVSTAAGEAGAALAAAAEVANTGMLGLAATMGTIVAQLVLWAPTVALLLAQGGSAPGAGTAANPLSDKQLAGQRYQQGHGGQMPPGYQQWLQGSGPMPPGMDFHPGEQAAQPAAPAPAGAPPAAGYTPGPPPAQWTPGPGQAPMTWVPGQGYVPSGAYPGAPSLITPDQLDATGGRKGPRLPEAPQVPYPAGYGAPPGPGESAEQYSHEQDILEKRHNIDETTARLNQLEQTNNASAEDIQKAKNEQLKAISEYNKAELEQTKKHTGDMQEFGAKIDNDFGISKGLSGIAENLTKFVANLAFAPVFGALGGAQAAAGFPGGQGLGGAKGLVGMAGLSGAFGPQFTVAGGAGGPSAGGHSGGGNTGAAAPAPAGGAAASSGWWGASTGFTQTGPYGGPDASGQFPQWVKDIGARFHLTPSTYGGHQTGNRNEPGFAPNPGGANRGIDWNGSPQDEEAFADFARGHPELFEQFIHNDPGSGTKTGIAGGRLVGPGTDAPGYYGADWGGHGDHDHTRFGQGFMFPTPPGFAEGGTLGNVGAPAGAAPSFAPSGPDTVPAMLSPGEHVLTTQDVNALGGQQAVYDMRASLHGPQPSTAGGSGATQIGGLGAMKGLGSGFTVTGGGLIGVAESIPATAASMAMSFAAHGGAAEDLAHFASGGAVSYFGAGGAGGDGDPGAAGAGGAGAAGAGAGTAGAAAAAGPSAAGGLGAAGAASGTGTGTGAGGGGAPGGSVIGAAIGIGIQEMNEAISKSSQMAGALVGGLQQTFGLQQFAQTPLAQSGWLSRIIGGIAGAQPQLPNMGGQSAGKASPEGVPGMTPMMTPPQEVSPFGPGRGTSPGPTGPPQAPAPPPQHPPGAAPPSSALGDAGVGPNPNAFQGPPTPNSVAGGAGGFRGFAQGGDVSGSAGGGGSSNAPAVHIEHYHDEGSSNSAGQDIARHVESSYSAQQNTGSR